MTYRKLVVDNPLCMRRYHIAFDDEAPKTATAEIRCPHCPTVIYRVEDHPMPRLLREENLTKVMALSGQLVDECAFEDRFTK